jgi:hypothetical protein
VNHPSANCVAVDVRSQEEARGSLRNVRYAPRPAALPSNKTECGANAPSPGSLARTGWRRLCVPSSSPIASSRKRKSVNVPSNGGEPPTPPPRITSFAYSAGVCPPKSAVSSLPLPADKSKPRSVAWHATAGRSGWAGHVLAIPDCCMRSRDPRHRRPCLSHRSRVIGFSA